MEVGDYVRTKNGNIRKIEEVINKDYNEPDYGVDKIVINIEEVEDTIYMEPFLYKEDIIKSSPNIIDILEVGDYVNGYLVIEKDINNELRYIDLKDRNMKYVKYLDVKSIVTKEMFSSIEYEVKQ